LLGVLPNLARYGAILPYVAVMLIAIIGLSALALRAG
jgi:hypothetical protein